MTKRMYISKVGAVGKRGRLLLNEMRVLECFREIKVLESERTGVCDDEAYV